MESRWRRAFARRGHGSNFFKHHRRRAPPQHLVPLCHHVRSAFYSYGARRGYACGALHGSGPRWPRLEALRPHRLDARDSAVQRHHCRFVGLFSLSRRCRSAGRNQFALAALRHLESIAGCGGARRSTTILMKMGRLRWIWVTLLPMAWLVVITMTASYQKIFDANPRIGFLAYANALAAQIAAGKIPAAKLVDTQRLIFNQRLDAAVTAVLALMILVLIVEALVQWSALLSG